MIEKNYITYAFAVLLIAILAIMDGLNNSNAAEELRKEKDRLAEKAAIFEKEYENNAKMLDVARIDGLGYYAGERSGKCHCGFIFNGEGFEWIPNSVLDLKEFRIEKWPRHRDNMTVRKSGGLKKLHWWKRFLIKKKCDSVDQT